MSHSNRKWHYFRGAGPMLSKLSIEVFSLRRSFTSQEAGAGEPGGGLQAGAFEPMAGESPVPDD
jgi:hypothetical protein